MNTLSKFYSTLKSGQILCVDGKAENVVANLSRIEVEQITCHIKASNTTALETESCRFSVAHLQSGLSEQDDGSFLLGGGHQEVRISFKPREQVAPPLTGKSKERLYDDLRQSLAYIENVRHYGVNPTGKRRLPKSKNADLYFAGKAIIDVIREHGTAEDIKQLDQQIKRQDAMFKRQGD